MPRVRILLARLALRVAGTRRDVRTRDRTAHEGATLGETRARPQRRAGIGSRVGTRDREELRIRDGDRDGDKSAAPPIPAAAAVFTHSRDADGTATTLPPHS